MLAGKKRIVTAYLILAVLAVIALAMFAGWKLIPDAQRNQAYQEYEDSLTQLASTTLMGEAMVLDSKKGTVTDFEGEQECIFDWSGTMKVKVLSAALYDSRAAAELKKGRGESDLDDGEAFLLCEVRIENVDARYTSEFSDLDGWSLTCIRPNALGELTYEYCKDKKAIDYSDTTPYAQLKPGQAETYVLGWCLYEVPLNCELYFDNKRLTACTLEVTDRRTTKQ